MFIRSNASRTSSTLFGRTMLLMSFIGGLQRSFECLSERNLVGLVQLAALLGYMQYVDCFSAFRRDEHEIDIATRIRNRATQPEQESGCVVGHDFDDRVALRVFVVDMNPRFDVAVASM